MWSYGDRSYAKERIADDDTATCRKIGVFLGTQTAAAALGL